MFRKIAISLAALAAAFMAVVTNSQPRARGVAGSPDHHHRSVGRGRRRRSIVARAFADDRERSRRSGQRRAASRRQRRGRPYRDRASRARRLHMGPRHRRNHHDALAGSRADPAERFHRRLDHQRRRRRADRAHGIAVQDREGIARRHQGEAGRHLQGVRHRPGRHLASRSRRLAARRKDRSEESAVGAEPGRRSLDAGPRRGRRRFRHRIAAGRPRADRRRQGARARADGYASASRFTRTFRR